MNKKTISIFFMIMLVGIINLCSDAFAEYVTTIDAFEYKEYDIPAYDGDIYEYINNNDPMFTEEEIITEVFEIYSEQDDLGRCRQAFANICTELQPTEERGDISSVIPTGWIQNMYDIVSGKYLYNRSHLIGWQLTGENANEKNLITGTRQFNVEGMLPFENIVDDYFEDVDNENNHVLYRVTPLFDDNNLLAKGVLLEAQSVEETEAEGGIEFCVFVYNVQDGIAIDYATGENKLAEEVNEEEVQIPLKDCNIKLSGTTYTYNRKVIKPTVTITYGKINLVNGKDYTIKYKNNINAGTANVEIQGIGKYSGVITKKYTIKPRSISGLTYSKLTSKKYTGKKIVPGMTVKYGGISLKKNSDFAIAYSSNINPGIGKIVIKGKGNYTGSKTFSFYIVPKKIAKISTSVKKNSITAKWTKHAGITGYQIAYRKMGANKYKYITVKANSKVIKGLTSKKYHQIKVRAYKKVGGKVLYGEWSGVKKVRTK